MGLRFDPVGGGQFKQAVQQIIEAESQPIRTLNARKTKEDSRLKLFQDFKTKFSGLDKALAEISSFRKFRDLKADLGDGGSLMSVTIDKDRAETGVYQMEIDQLAVRSSVISNGFEDPNDPILGMGFVALGVVDGPSTEIFIDDKDSSLFGVASLINRAPNSTVQASVIKDASALDAPWKLLITSKKDGAMNQMEIPEFYFLDGATDFYVDDDKESANSQILIDGFPIETESNDVSDFLPGVNIHLKQARPDQPFTMTITEDYQKMSGKVKALVDQVNQVLQFIVKQNAVDAHSDTSTTFAGDSSLQTLEYKIRNAFHEGYPGQTSDDEDPVTLFATQLGIEFQKDGTLSFKEDKFQKRLESDFDHIAEFITGSAGLVNRLRGIFDTYTRPGQGLLTVKEKGLRSRIQDIDTQIDQKTRYIERRKQDLVSQFARLEATLGNLQKQQQYLSATLPGAGGGGNMVAQLLGG